MVDHKGRTARDARSSILLPRIILSRSFPSPTAMSAVRLRLQAHHQQEIDRFDRVIGMSDMNGPAAGRYCELLSVFYRDRSAVGQIDINRQEWRCRVQLAYLLNGHVGNLIAHRFVTSIGQIPLVDRRIQNKRCYRIPARLY